MGLHAVLGPFYDIQCRRQYRHCHPPEAQSRGATLHQGWLPARGLLAAAGICSLPKDQFDCFFQGWKYCLQIGSAPQGSCCAPSLYAQRIRNSPFSVPRPDLVSLLSLSTFFAWTDYLICWSADELGTAQLQKWDFSRSQGVLQLGKHQMAVSAAGNEVITQGG